MVIWSVLSRFCFEEAIDRAVWSRCEVGQGGLRKAHCRNSLQFEFMSDFTFSRSVEPSLWTAVTWNRSSPCFLSSFVQSQP